MSIKGFVTEQGQAFYDFTALENVPEVLKNIPVAKVGQLIVVKSVDAEGRITAFETIDMKESGSNGEDGGYYIPSVSQPDANTVKFMFESSKEGMSSVEPKTITLPAGKEGVGISSVVMNADYTLTFNFTDGTSYTTPSIRGAQGEDGYSPWVSVARNTNNNCVVISVNNRNSSEVATVYDGKDGVSPIVTVSDIEGGHQITVTDVDGTKTFEVMNGSKGDKGNGIKSVELNADYTLTLTYDNGTSYTTPSIRGAKGADGKQGESFASFQVDEDGNLYVITSGSTNPNQFEYDETTGELHYVQTTNDGTSVKTPLGNIRGEYCSYVIGEAEKVVDKVIESQGSRTFTFAAITDLHLDSWGYTEGITTYPDGVIHACQAMKYIDSRIKLDAIALLGDYTDGMAHTQQGTAVADFKGVNAILDKLRFAPNLRLQGNHDFVAEKSPIAYRYISAYNDGSVEWGSPLGGYFFKDFTTQKIRVICLNTSEASNNHLSVSVEQYQWFINSLDLSSKENASEWGVLILSHIPLDSWVGSGGKYRFAYILNAYSNGTSWTDGDVSCDFSDGKNAAHIIGNIHGHVHNFKVDKLYLGNIEGNPPQIDVWRMATPNACFGLENKDYTGYKEDTVYTKTANSATDTAFCIYCIDLDSHTIKAICYGAGYDRTLNYQSGSIVTEETHSITNNLTNVTNSNSSIAIEDGKSYSANLMPVSGQISNVSITMGGEDITASVYADGVISIQAVTGDIVITAIAVAVEIVNVLTTSVNADGTPYNEGQGWKADTRWSGSSGAEQTPYSGVYLSGYIPYDGTEGTVYLKNVSTASRLKVWYFEADSMTNFTYQRELAQNQIPDVTYGADGNVTSFKLEKDCDYIRIECNGFSTDSIIAINQPIE